MPSAKQKNEPGSSPRKTTPIFHFLGLVGGMTALLLLVLSALSFFYGGAENTENSESHQTQSAVVENSLTTASQLMDARTTTDFSKTLAIATAQELADYLEKTNFGNELDDRIPVRVERSRRRVKAAEQLMLLTNEQSLYELAAKSKLLALSTIFNSGMDSNFKLEVTEEADELLKFANKLVNEKNLSLKLHAKLTVIGVELVESAKNSTSSNMARLVESVSQKILKMFADFDHNADTADYLKAVFPRVEALNREFVSQVRHALLKQADEFSGEEYLQRFFADLYDIEVTAKSGIADKLNEVWIENEKGEQALLDAAIELASDPKGGLRLLNEIATIAHRIEQEQRHHDAKRIYEVLLDSVKQRADSQIVELVIQTSENGIRRCEAIGKPFSFAGKLIDGSDLEPNSLKNCYVIVMFLSRHQTNLAALLNELYGEFESLHNRNVKFVAVVIEKEGSEEFKQYRAVYPILTLVERGEDTSNPPTLFQQYPAQIIPQAILIDPTGKVVRTAIKLIDLSSVTNLELLDSSQ